MSTPYFHRTLFYSPRSHRRSGSAPSHLSSPQAETFAGTAGTDGSGTPMTNRANAAPFFPLYRKKEELMAEESQLAFQTLRIVGDNTLCEQFLDRVFSADRNIGYGTEMELQHGIADMRDLTQQFSTFLDRHRHYHEQELSRIAASEDVVRDIISTSIPAANNLVKQVANQKSGEQKPEKITKEWLTRFFAWNGHNVVRLSSDDLASHMFCNSWEDIVKLTDDEELLAILEFLGAKDYIRNEHFAANVSKYKRLGVIRMNFTTSQILKSRVNYSTAVLQGLIGIYFDKLPEELHGYTFDHKKAQPWTKRGGAASASAATPGTATTASAATPGTAATASADTFGGPAFPSAGTLHLR